MAATLERLAILAGRVSAVHESHQHVGTRRQADLSGDALPSLGRHIQHPDLPHCMLAHAGHTTRLGLSLLGAVACETGVRNLVRESSSGQSRQFHPASLRGREVLFTSQ